MGDVREVLDELIAMAARNAAGHAELYEAAVKHGRDDMAMRAQSAVTAWQAVATELRLQLRRTDDDPGGGTGVVD
jgi:hypothetical protein